ncbi:glucosamine-6-phosphate deaminase [Christensenellaceae bacterium 44-20]
MRSIHVKSYAQLSFEAAKIIAAQIALKQDTVLGLATGSTPVGAYQQLAEWNQQDKLDFSQVRTFNLDEYRGLAGDHPQSYRYFMQKHLFSQINILPENTHVPQGDCADANAECAHYDSSILAAGGIDLQLLGIGHNGHIGFNEPSSCFVLPTHEVALTQRTLEANSRFFDAAEQQPRSALTMGIAPIMQAKRILLISQGAEKMPILEKALYGPVTPEVPASILQLHPDLTVIYNESDC